MFWPVVQKPYVHEKCRQLLEMFCFKHSKHHVKAVLFLVFYDFVWVTFAYFVNLSLKSTLCDITSIPTREKKISTIMV